MTAHAPGGTGQTRPLVLLVDDHPAVLQGLALVLEADGIGECRQARGRTEALEAVARQAPDLALVGLSMDCEETTALVAELHARRIPVLVCARQEAPTQVKRALAAGARGYVSKADAPAGIVRAVRDVLAGWILISPTAAEGLDEGAGLVPATGSSRGNGAPGGRPPPPGDGSTGAGR